MRPFHERAAVIESGGSVVEHGVIKTKVEELHGAETHNPQARIAALEEELRQARRETRGRSTSPVQAAEEPESFAEEAPRRGRGRPRRLPSESAMPNVPPEAESEEESEEPEPE
jgi:hypothetical protein